MCHFPDLLWHPLRRRQALQPLLSLMHIFICCQDWKTKRRKKGVSWSPLWALSLILGRFVFHAQSTHIHSHGWSFPAHISASEAVSQRGEKCLRIKIKMTGKFIWKWLYKSTWNTLEENPVSDLLLKDLKEWVMVIYSKVF